MKKQLLFILALLLVPALASAQVRYFDEVFTNVDVTSYVQYGTANESFPTDNPAPADDTVNLFMDIYQPQGDDPSVYRPAVILAPSGSFLDSASLVAFGVTAPNGNKEDWWIEQTANALARRGYVVIAMEHRAGWNPLAPTQDEKAGSIFNAVFRAQQDLRAVVRYLKRDRATVDTLKIDTSRIAAGGSSSGAYAAIHADVLDDNNRAGVATDILLPRFVDGDGDPFIDTTIVGGYEGTSNGDPANAPAGADNPYNYSSDFDLVLCLGGAVGDTQAVVAGDNPVIAMHGVDDQTTPYLTELVVTAIGSEPIITVSGSRDYVLASQGLGNQAPMSGTTGSDSLPGLLPFPGEGFEFYNIGGQESQQSTAQSGIDSAQAFLDQIWAFMIPRMYDVFFDTTIVSINEQVSAELGVYPNPATELVNVRLENGQLTGLQVLDINGRSVRVVEGLQGRETQLDVADLRAGFYFLRVETTQGVGVRRLLVR